MQRIVDQARKNDGVPRTAQQSIPFDRMFPDGICRVGDNYYTRTVRFQDINYQLAQQEDKTAIFEEWCSFLNFFDSSVHFELSFVNLATDAESFEKSIRIPPQHDGYNSVRAEYSQMLRTQLEQGNNGLTKTKYLTFGIEADSIRQAKPRLAHVMNDILNNFRQLGVMARPLNGKERLKLMHDMFHMGDPEDRFHFDWKWLVKSGLSAKDFIAPTAFAFPGSRIFQMGNLYGSMSYLAITASDLSDQLLKDFLDMDIIPSDLATYGKDAKALLQELQSQNERMFLITFLIMNTGRTKQELETNVFQASSIAQKHNCMLIVQDQVWGRVTENRSAGRSTRYYMDEFHLLLKEEQTAAYSVEIWNSTGS